NCKCNKQVFVIWIFRNEIGEYLFHFFLPHESLYSLAVLAMTRAAAMSEYGMCFAINHDNITLLSAV
ncbi:hypothetical protein QIG87_27000, partial [Klebsiella pneumoniae]|nr:hypothetical protein [Klebsiella pneumoniae]